MSDERLFTFRNRWFAVSVLGTIAIAVVSALIGFVWLTRPPFGVAGGAAGGH